MKLRILSNGPKMRWTQKIQISHIFLGLVLGCFVVLIALAFHSHHSFKSLKEQQAQDSRSNHSGDRHVIRGFQYDAYANGRRVLSIKAEEFSIQKKKLGFFRFGLMNEARFQNASIHLYGTSDQPEKTSTPDQRSIESGNSPERAPSTINIGDILSQNPFPALPTKRISTIKFEPVKFVFHNRNSGETRISARRARIQLRSRSVILNGGVRVESGSRLLTTQKLILHPESATLSTDSQYKLDLPGKVLAGRNLATDIFLNLKKQQEPKLSQNQVHLLEASGNLLGTLTP